MVAEKTTGRDGEWELPTIYRHFSGGREPRESIGGRFRGFLTTYTIAIPPLPLRERERGNH